MEDVIVKLTENIQKADKKLDEIEKGLAGKIGKEDLKAITESIESVKSVIASVEQVDGKKLGDYVKATQAHADALEKQLTEMKAGMKVKEMTIQDKVKNLILSDDWKSHSKSLATKQTGNFRAFEIEKAANDLLTSDWTADTGAIGLPVMQLPGVTKHPWKATPIFASIPKRTVGMEHQISYTEELTRSDAAALKAEGSQYAQSGATWITKVLPFYDFGHYVKLTRESMEDTEYVMQEANDLLSNGLLRAIEALLFSGGGTTTVEGVYTAAQTFARPLGAKSITNASMRDVLLAAQLYVAKGYNAVAANDTGKTGYSANLAIIGKSSKYNLSTEKDEIGRPLIDNIEAWRPGGMSVMESEDVTETAASQTFVVGDFNKAMLFLKRNLVIETGYDGNDFTYGMITMRASLRGNLLIKAKEKYAFVKGDFVSAPGMLS